MKDTVAPKRAQKLIESGLKLVSRGKIEDAREHFKSAAEQFLTADSLTYWGWMEHRLGNTELAIRLCQQAIERDPEFGNPYNDIGSYLMAQGDLEKSIPWFYKAMRAKRYEARHFPHLNLARIYIQKRMPLTALRELKKAQRYAPTDPNILKLIEQVSTSFH